MDRLSTVNMQRNGWAAVQRELAAGDRIMERAFCAGPVDRLTIGMPAMGTCGPRLPLLICAPDPTVGDTT